MNQIGFQPSFKSNVNLVGYHRYTDKQKAMVNQPGFVKALKNLEGNGAYDNVCIVQSRDGDNDLEMIVTKNDEFTSISDSSYLYANDSYKTIMKKYKMSRAAIDNENNGQHTVGVTVEKPGKIGEFIA